MVDIVYSNEMEKVIEEARGKLITTTLVDYHSPTEVQDDYTSRRTSKVKMSLVLLIIVIPKIFKNEL